MSVCLRLFACVALLASCNVGTAGFFSNHLGCFGYVHFPPSSITGTHLHIAQAYSLKINPDGCAELRYNLDARGVLASGVVLVTEDMPSNEFVFKGFSTDVTDKGEAVLRRYKSHYNHEQERTEITDITDADNPIKLSPEEPSFPWTAAFVFSALIIGGLVGRYSAKWGYNPNASVSPQ